jgi:DNA-binding response OmpR family regulator
MSKVMVVDDALADLRMMETILRTAGHDVIGRTEGEGTEQAVLEERPDLLLLDIVMPKRNGYEILRRLKKDDRTRRMPVVLVSCRKDETDRLWGKRQGADEYLAKPFTRGDLLGVVGLFTAPARPPLP